MGVGVPVMRGEYRDNGQEDGNYRNYGGCIRVI